MFLQHRFPGEGAAAVSKTQLSEAGHRSAARAVPLSLTDHTLGMAPAALLTPCTQATRLYQTALRAEQMWGTRA